MSWILILVAALGVYMLLSWFKNKQRPPLPPGPSVLECLQISLRCLKNFEIHLISVKLWKRYGDLVRINFLGSNIVFVNSVRLSRKLITSAKYKDFTNERPPSFIQKFIVKNGKDIAFSPVTEMHMKLRKLIHTVSKIYGTGIKDFEDMVNTQVRILEDQLQAGAGRPVFDLDRALTNSLIHIIHMFLTNQRPSNSEELCTMVEEYDRFVDLLFRFDNEITLTILPFLKYIPGSTKKLVDDSMASHKQVQDFYLGPEMCKSVKGNGSLIATLLEEMEKDPEITNDHAEGVVTDVLVAGFITTKGTLNGFFLLMMYYPEVQRKIQQELDEKIERDRHPSLDDRPELHYTNAVILEVFRYIRHTVIGVPHLASKDLEFEEYTIPAHSMIILNHWVMARDDSVWDDPYSFKPERFLDEDGKLVSVDHRLRQQLITFGIGIRSCVGESFARTRIFLYVTSLLQKFTFSPGDNVLPPEDSARWMTKAVLCPQFLNCVVEKRK